MLSVNAQFLQSEKGRLDIWRGHKKTLFRNYLHTKHSFNNPGEFCFSDAHRPAFWLGLGGCRWGDDATLLSIWEQCHPGK